MEESKKQPATANDDEILVKGEDDKWYILKGDELLPYKSGTVMAPAKAAPVVKVAPVVPASAPAPAVKTIPPVPRPAFKNIHEGHPLFKGLEELVAETVQEVNFSFTDQLLAKRFRNLVSARLRDVKDTLETKDALLRDLKIGGLAMRLPEAERVSAILEKSFKKFGEKWRAVEEKKIAEWKKKKIEDEVKREIEEKKKEGEEIDKMRFGLLARAGFKEKTALPPPALKKIEIVVPSEKPKPVSRPVAAPPPPAKIPKPPAPPSVVQPRPTMVDVKFTPRLLSPLEELKEMTLIDFRRLGREPSEAILKIKAKIELLERESFAKKMEGLAAWKQSEPMRLFRELSSGAVQTGRSVVVLVSEREKNQKKTLTEAEFYAIMELNKSLRF